MTLPEAVGAVLEPLEGMSAQHRTDALTQAYNGSQPVWRCSYCNCWEPRNGESAAYCPWCLSDHGNRRTAMTATIRREPVASSAWGTAFEDL